MYKGYVLITGASSGIGYELARVFAKENYDLILVARSQERLERIAEQIRERDGVQVYVLAKDLVQPGAADEIHNEVRRLCLDVNILVNNAGFGYAGLFHEAAPQADGDMIQVNITSLTKLTKLFSVDMVGHGHGKILNVASTGSYHPGPYTAVYYATKAYVLSFSEAIARELAPYNISVTSLCPGATRTNFANRAGKEDTKGAMDPHVVALAAYKGLMKKKRVVVPGLHNWLFIHFPRGLGSKLVGIYQSRLLKRD